MLWIGAPSSRPSVLSRLSFRGNEDGQKNGGQNRFCPPPVNYATQLYASPQFQRIA